MAKELRVAAPTHFDYDASILFSATAIVAQDKAPAVALNNLI